MLEQYKFTDEFAMAEGFEENAEFFTLTYETPLAVSYQSAFARIAPLLWLRAGSVGRRIDKLPAPGWEVVEAYLTTRHTLAPDVDQRGRKHKLVKHALFEELHLALTKKRLQPLTRTFLDFMKENDLAAPEPFKRHELQRAEEALAIAEKCRTAMSIVTNDVNATFKANLRVRCNLTRPTRNAWGIQSYLAKHFSGPIKYVGLSLEPYNGQILFYVWMTGTRHSAIAQIRKHLNWDETEGSGCCSEIKLRGDRGDIARMVAHAKAASRELGRAIRRFA